MLEKWSKKVSNKALRISDLGNFEDGSTIGLDGTLGEAVPFC